MEDLFSYRLTDFLMFSEQTYWRLFSRYNQSIFPLPLLSLAFGLYCLYAFVAFKKIVIKPLLMLIALAWLWIGFRFFGQLYSEINVYAGYLAVLFWLQGLLLLSRSFKTVTYHAWFRHPFERYIGWVLWIMALLMLPLFEILLGKSMNATSSFALTPDSIAIVSIALVLILNIKPWWVLAAALWLMISTLTYWAMGSLLSLPPFITLLIYGWALWLQKRNKSGDNPSI